MKKMFAFFVGLVVYRNFFSPSFWFLFLIIIIRIIIIRKIIIRRRNQAKILHKRKDRGCASLIETQIYLNKSTRFLTKLIEEMEIHNTSIDDNIFSSVSICI